LIGLRMNENPFKFAYRHLYGWAETCCMEKLMDTTLVIQVSSGPIWIRRSTSAGGSCSGTWASRSASGCWSEVCSMGTGITTDSDMDCLFGGYGACITQVLPIHVGTQFLARHRTARGLLNGRAAFGGDRAMPVDPLVHKLRWNPQRFCKAGLSAPFSGCVVGKSHLLILSDSLREIKHLAYVVFKQFGVK